MSQSRALRANCSSRLQPFFRASSLLVPFCLITPSRNEDGHTHALLLRSRRKVAIGGRHAGDNVRDVLVRKGRTINLRRAFNRLSPVKKFYLLAHNLVQIHCIGVMHIHSHHLPITSYYVKSSNCKRKAAACPKVVLSLHTLAQLGIHCQKKAGFPQ